MSIAIIAGDEVHILDVIGLVVSILALFFTGGRGGREIAAKIIGEKTRMLRDALLRRHREAGQAEN